MTGTETPWWRCLILGHRYGFIWVDSNGKMKPGTDCCRRCGKGPRAGMPTQRDIERGEELAREHGWE